MGEPDLQHRHIFWRFFQFSHIYGTDLRWGNPDDGGVDGPNQQRNHFSGNLGLCGLPRVIYRRLWNTGSKAAGLYDKLVGGRHQATRGEFGLQGSILHGLHQFDGSRYGQRPCSGSGQE